MKRPSGNRSRKITDTNQVYLDSVNPPVNPEVGKTVFNKLAPKPLHERTSRVGK